VLLLCGALGLAGLAAMKGGAWSVAWEWMIWSPSDRLPRYTLGTLFGRHTEANIMADGEALRAALREAETAILDVAKLIDPAGPGDRQAAEDIEAAGYVVRKWREVLEAEYVALGWKIAAKSSS
jgi:hypothetical protein